MGNVGNEGVPAQNKMGECEICFRTYIKPATCDADCKIPQFLIQVNHAEKHAERGYKCTVTKIIDINEYYQIVQQFKEYTKDWQKPVYIYEYPPLRKIERKIKKAKQQAMMDGTCICPIVDCTGCPIFNQTSHLNVTIVKKHSKAETLY